MIDFHSHLDLYPDPFAVRDECHKREMYVLAVTTTPSAWPGSSSLVAGTERIRLGLGLHPQLAHERKGELGLFDRYLKETRYVGEIGLDGLPENRINWESQTMVFRHILAKCVEAGGRILSIHSRRASGPVLDYLSEFSGAGTPILHWFSGGIRDLDRAIELGCWFSVGPAMVTGEKGRELVARMPRERVLTESDGPFTKNGGVTLMPWDVKLAFPALTGIWSVSEDDVEEIIQNNLSILLSTHSKMYPIEVVRS
jgi:TatD DNase family protein